MKNYVLVKSDKVTSEMIRHEQANSLIKSFNGKLTILSFEIKDHAAFLGLKWLNREQALKIKQGFKWTGKGILGFFYRIFT